MLPRALFEAFNPNDKTNLAPYRFLHLSIVIILGARFIPIDAPGLQSAIWKPLIKCGQQSLEVFAVGIYLAFIGHFLLTMTSGGIIAQLLVGTVGIAIMTAVAYYRSWSKRIEKQPATSQPVRCPSTNPMRREASRPGRLDRQSAASRDRVARHVHRTAPGSSPRAPSKSA